MDSRDIQELKECRLNMINESNLNKYYSQIAEKLDEIIPCDWNKIILYAEETGDVSSASFNFFTVILRLIIVEISQKNIM